MDKKNRIIPLLLFIIVLALYLLTLSPAVNFEDSGEFIASAYTLSIAHPPGYPLYLVLGKLFTFSGLGTNESRINFMSAFFSALSALILYILIFRILIILKENKPGITAFLIILSYFLSSTLWGASVVAEVYSLNLFLTALLLLLIELIFLEANETGGDPDSNRSKNRYHYLFFYLAGLSFGNHQTVIFILMLYSVFFIKNRIFKKFKLPDYFKSTLLFGLGFSIYLYLPIRALAGPAVNWGDPSNIKNIFSVILRQQYGEIGSTLISIRSFLQQCLTVNPVYEFFIGNASEINFNHFLPLFLLAGILYLSYYGLKKIRNKDIKLLFILLFVFYTFVIIFLTNTPKEKEFTLKVFFIPGWLSFYFILFYGLRKLLNKYFFYIIPPLLLGLILFNFNLQNKKKYFYARDYVLNILNNLPYKSILFTLKDNETFPVWNEKLVNQKRPDIAVLNLVLLSEQWYLNQITHQYPDLRIDLPAFRGNFRKNAIRETFLQNIISENPGRGIYFTAKRFEGFIDHSPILNSAGILYFTNQKDSPLLLPYEFNNLFDDFNNFKKYFNMAKVEKFRSIIPSLDTQTKYVLQSIAFSLLEYANNLLASGRLPAALIYYQYSIYLNNLTGVSINNIYAYINAGNILFQMQDDRRAVYFFTKGIELQPNTTLAKETELKVSQILSKETVNVTGLFRTAENYYRNRNYEEAIPYYEKLIQIQPSNPAFYGSIGDCYFNMNNYNSAIKYYKMAIEVKPDYINAYYNLGGCFIMTGDRKSAKKTWEAGLKYSPSNHQLLNAMNTYFK